MLTLIAKVKGDWCSIDEFAGDFRSYDSQATSLFSGDGGPATAANLTLPVGIWTTTSNDVLIADQLNFRVRKVDQNSAIISTFAGHMGSNTAASYAGLGDGGPATAVSVWIQPYQFCGDSVGSVYVIDSTRVRKIAANGILSTVAGNSHSYDGQEKLVNGVQATATFLGGPLHCAVDSNADLYLAESAANSVRKVTVTTGIVDFFAGYASDETYSLEPLVSKRTSAALYLVSSLFIDSAGSFYANSQTGGAKIRKCLSGSDTMIIVVGMAGE